MIKKVQAVSLEKMQQHKANGFKDPIFAGHKLVIISVTNTDFDPIFETCGHILALQIDDIYPSSRWKWLDCQNSKEMTIEQAEQVLDHIMNFHHLAEADVFLLVNCHMGESRSGAIARFAQEYAGIDDADFKAMNPNISPNPWMHAMLYHAYNLKYDFGAKLPANMANGFIPQKYNCEL